MKKLLVVSVLMMTIVLSGTILASDFQGTIRLWDYPHGEGVRSWWDEVINEFEEQNPGVEIEFTQLTWAGGTEKINVAVASGNLPDIVNQGTQVEFIEQGALEDLSGYFSEEELANYYQASIDAFRYKEGIYGWPWYLFPYHMYLNAGLFEERGVELPENGQWTYDEFVEKMDKLTFDRDGDGENDVYGIAYNVQPDFYDFWPVLLSDGAKLFNEDYTEFLLNSPEGLSGLNKIIDLSNKYNVALPNTAGMSQDDQWAAFLNERTIAATATGIWGVGAVNSYNQDLEQKKEDGEDTEGDEPFNLAVANYPSGKEMAQPIVITGGFGVFKQQNQAKLDKIVEFLKFATSAAQQENIISETDWLGFIPTNISVDAEKYYSDDPNMIGVIELMDEARAWPPMIPSWNQIGDKVSRQIQLACQGQISPEDALKTAEREVQRILDKNNR